MKSSNFAVVVAVMALLLGGCGSGGGGGGGGLVAGDGSLSADTPSPDGAGTGSTGTVLEGGGAGGGDSGTAAGGTGDSVSGDPSGDADTDTGSGSDSGDTGGSGGSGSGGDGDDDFTALVNPIVFETWVNGSAEAECARVGEFAYGFKVDAAAPDGLWEHAGNEIAIINDGDSFWWEATVGIGAVIVKGGLGANAFVYDPAELYDSGLHAPLNAGSGEPREISHVTFCWNPDEGSEE
ncbi:MAG: hypothetical protein SCH98_00425 [Deferrisomatales bacterium]|nr:hypothetical protein [Deferrisomatales bacterium]